MLADTGLMDPRDYKTYTQLFRHMSNFMCKPSVIVYLDVSPERSMERIQQRSRDVEGTIEVLGKLKQQCGAQFTSKVRFMPRLLADCWPCCARPFIAHQLAVDMLQLCLVHH